jgi:hypothetical protein
MSAASDAHTPWEIGLAYVEMPPFEGPGDFLIALSQGAIVGRRAFVGYAAFNVWAKLKWQLRLGKSMSEAG